MTNGSANPDSTDSPNPFGRLGYAPPAGGFDEARNPHWAPFFASLDELGPAEIAHRWWDAQHLIRENGVTYNVYGDPRGAARPWQLGRATAARMPIIATTIINSISVKPC